MSDKTTRRMINAYRQDAMPQMFLSGFFQSPPINFHNSEKVEIDIVRSDENIAIVVTDLTTGYRLNAEDLFTNKEFTPPILKEAAPLNAFDLIKREPGQDPFVDPNFQANAAVRAFSVFRNMESKIRRTIELQSSQVMQTGTIILTDINGNPLYQIDFAPKATHFPTVATAWSAAGADPAADINSLAEVIRNDGLSDPDQLIMGIDSFENFIKNDDIQKRYDNRRIDLGTIAPALPNGQGGQFRGIVEIGNYRYDIWTYGGRYIDPNGGVKKQFVDPNKVIVRASTGRMDATFGSIPRIVPPDSRVLQFLPDRMAMADGGLDMFTNAWVTADGEQLFVGVGSRPLMIPTAIDTYGCLTTTV